MFTRRNAFIVSTRGGRNDQRTYRQPNQGIHREQWLEAGEMPLSCEENRRIGHMTIYAGKHTEGPIAERRLIVMDAKISRYPDSRSTIKFGFASTYWDLPKIA